MDVKMKGTVAIASGKGGTGKTTVAVNLSVIAADSGLPVSYVDCDVEEPNGHIFMQPVVQGRQVVNAYYPQVDLDRCVHCNKCGEICQYSAIMDIKTDVLVFPDLCHSCGGCTLVCPVQAISEVPKPMGRIIIGIRGDIRFVSGTLTIGHPFPAPLISAVKKSAVQEGLTILDAPPGTSCPVVETLKGVDYVVLVTEPTPFGLNDLKLAVELVSEMKIPFGVVINRAGIGNDETRKFCVSRHIPILAEIPDSRKIAEAYSRGEISVEAMGNFKEYYVKLLTELKKRMNP